MVALKLKQIRGLDIRKSVSRNAVVALKRQPIRQGGFGVGLKQERRGGIETQETRNVFPAHRVEAGTPWWH